MVRGSSTAVFGFGQNGVQPSALLGLTNRGCCKTHRLLLRAVNTAEGGGIRLILVGNSLGVFRYTYVAEKLQIGDIHLADPW